MGEDIVVLLSGGLDSTIAMAWAKASGYSPVPLTFRYGQKHEREVQSALDVAAFYKAVEFGQMDLTDSFEMFGGCLTNMDERVPQDLTYEDLQRAEGVSPTYVPFRNGILLSFAAAYAYDNGIPKVCYGAHATDARRGAYPDCTPAFAQAMKDSIFYGTGSKVDLLTPFITMTKAQVLEQGFQLNAPIHLTWSCYLGGLTPCEKCPTCLERAEAFRYVGKEDPLLGR